MCFFCFFFIGGNHFGWLANLSTQKKCSYEGQNIINIGEIICSHEAAQCRTYEALYLIALYLIGPPAREPDNLLQQNLKNVFSYGLHILPHDSHDFHLPKWAL